LAHTRRIHLHIGIELAGGIRICCIGGKINRCRNRLELDVDACLLASLLDDGLSFLAGALIEVRNTSFSFFPSSTRMPSGPRFQPASSSRWFAFSTLNSHLVFFEIKRSGLLIKFPVATPVRP
jgi:hypothetical protein